MARPKGESPMGGGMSPQKTGTLTKSAYSDAVKAYTRAKGAMPVLDSLNPEDLECFDAWIEYLARVLGQESWRVKQLKSARMGRNGETRWTVAERYPWEMTGEMPFIPRRFSSTDPRPPEDPAVRKAMAAYLRSIFRNGHPAEGDTADEVLRGEQIYLGIKARRRRP